MKFLLISITLLLFQANCVSVKLTDVCVCTTILAQKDCLQYSKCEWDSTTSKCKTPTTTTTARFSSKTCTDTKTCIKQQGCAMVDSKCVIMGDCQSYLGKSNSECQKFSNSCNWDPEFSTCTSDNVCSKYSGEDKKTDCESVTQSNGESWCKFNTEGNACVKKECSDYTKTTDSDCYAALSGGNCVSDKKKCLTQLVSCDTYSAADCLSVNASNGPCELNSDKSKCQQKSCQGATDSTTDTGCDTYLKGCITNNKTCVKTLTSCSTYSSTDCTTLKGNKGTCLLTTDATPKCRDPTCEDYQETSDQSCQTKMTSCITNGVYCLQTLPDKCDAYQPSDITSCVSMISKEGKCKSVEGNTKCQLDQCEDQNFTTNVDCNKYSAIGTSSCITNGVKCVGQLESKCSDIKISDSTNCEQYISKEGKCKLKTGTTCELDSCNEKTFTTDEECQKYSSIGLSPQVVCKTDGAKCVDNLKLCSEYQQSDGCSTHKGSDGQCVDDSTDGSSKCAVISCDKITEPSDKNCVAGNSACKFNGLNCVKDLLTCDKYTSNCDTMISIDKAPCTTSLTDSTKCTKKTCLTAPTSNKTDADCIKYLAGCVTTGQGCIGTLSTCDSYKGVKSSCEQFIGKDGRCTAPDTNKVEDKCIVKDCANATSVTNDSSCNTYSPTCYYSARIQKCQTKVLTCASLKTQTNCENNLTSESSLYCVWDGANCLQATCNTIYNVKTKEACAVFGANCEFDNLSGCKDKTNYTCSTLRSASLCLQDSQGNACLWDSTNMICLKYNKCSDYQLTPLKENETKTSDQVTSETEICKLISNKCYSIGGNNCVSKTPCSVITEEKNCSGAIGIDDKDCGYDAKAKVCKTFGSCTDLELNLQIQQYIKQLSVTHVECQKYSSSCTSDGKTCVAIKNCSDATTKEICDLGGLDGKCNWSGSACSLWTCDNGTGTTHDACYKLSSSCTTDGSKCIKIAECSTYTDKNCVLGLKNTTCFYDKDKSACRNKVCADYTSVTAQSDCDKVGCGYDSESKACIAIASCSTYKKETLCNLNKQTDGKECVWVSTANGCKELVNCSDAPSNQSKCEKLDCYYVPAVTTGTNTTNAQCKSMDCYGKNQQGTAATGCLPFQNKDSNTLTFCGWNESSKKCVEVDPTGIYTVDNCFKLSQYTYYWSTTSSKCVSCKGGNSSTNNTTNSSNSTDNGTTTDSNAFRLESILFILLSFFLI